MSTSSTDRYPRSEFVIETVPVAVGDTVQVWAFGHRRQGTVLKVTKTRAFVEYYSDAARTNHRERWFSTQRTAHVWGSEPHAHIVTQELWK